MKQFWNDRYNQSDYVYGELPNAFLQEQLSEIVPGRLLLPGEGEGRNAVWAQKAGWKVTAIDFSDIAREKALALARRQGLPGLDYQVGDILEYAYPAHAFDAIALIFIHLDQLQRPVFHRRLVQALKPGGLMIVEAFTPNQLKLDSGGPQNPLMLYTADNLRSDFDQLSIISLGEQTVLLSEGAYHAGQAAVVRMLGRKQEE